MTTASDGADTAETAARAAAGTTRAALDPLMRAAQAGDGRAYRALLEEVALRMRRLVCARAPWLGRADVEDIVQDILLALHTARATWDPARPFMPWIAGIARNRLADHARRYVRRQAFDQAAQDLAEVFSSTPGQTHAEGVVNLMSVRRAMDGLSAGERDAFELVRLRQMSLVEAAERRGSTVGAMKVAVHRATRKLRAAIGRDGDDSQPVVSDGGESAAVGKDGKECE
jgi:RNA polymerase sigma factor (sigma-70 family)